MKVIMYMAMSLNGFIAKSNHDTPWSDEEWGKYESKVKEIGNLVVGKTTYDIYEEEDLVSMNNPRMVGVSSKDIKPTLPNSIYVKSPKAALDLLAVEGFKSAFIGGGTALNTYMLEEGLIDESILDVEPKLFSTGIPVFNILDNDFNLKLLNSSKYSDNGIQLHYSIQKSS